MSKRSTKVFSVFLLVSVMVLAVALVGCSGKPGPKDEEAIKSIQSSIEGGTAGLKVTSPITILEKGDKTPAGEYPFKVKYSVTGPDGSSKEVTAKFILAPGISDMGANIWNASEAK